MINKIVFCLADKPESFSFDFDYFTILKDGTITYENVTKYTGFGNSEFGNIESILLNMDRFDLIVHKTFIIDDWGDVFNGKGKTIYKENKIIYPETINFDNGAALNASLVQSQEGPQFTSLSKIKSLTIKPKTVWDLSDYEGPAEFYEHLPAIRREIKLKRIGI